MRRTRLQHESFFSSFPSAARLAPRRCAAVLIALGLAACGSSGGDAPGGEVQGSTGEEDSAASDAGFAGDDGMDSAEGGMDAGGDGDGGTSGGDDGSDTGGTDEGSSGDDSGGSTGETGETGSVDQTDGVPPTIVSLSPDIGATGVFADAQLVITFSEPMDTQSVEDAYSGTVAELASDFVSFSWNPEGTVLTVTPNELLPYATGEDALTLDALGFGYVIAADARDVSGEPMVADTDVDFHTLRRITSESVSRYTALSGTLEVDGNTQTTIPSVCHIGDTSGNEIRYCGVTFDLDDLASEAVEIEQAEALFRSTACWNSDVASDLGPLRLWHISFGSLNDLQPPGLFSSTWLEGVLFDDCGAEFGSLDVTDSVIGDYETNPSHQTQFRLYNAQGGTDGDGDAEYWRMQLNDSYPLLNVTYLTP